MSKPRMRQQRGCNGRTVGSLGGFLNPSLSAEERSIAKIEGWILGVS